MSRSEDVATVTIPLRVWGHLASEADVRGVTVSDLLVASIMRLLGAANRKTVVIGLVHAGLCDREISDATGELRSYVAAVRRDAGLPANKDAGRGSYV